MLSTGYSLGCAAALILNSIIPHDAEDQEGSGLPLLTPLEQELVPAAPSAAPASATVTEDVKEEGEGQTQLPAKTVAVADKA